MKGAYLLIIDIKKPAIIKIGSLGKIKFEKGNYVYVGSAMNNLEKRIKRHLKNSKDKKKYWHVDYLLSNKNAKIIKVIKKESNKKQECEIARKIVKIGQAVKNFGCSDCNCKTHLFYGSDKDIGRVVSGLELYQYFNAKT